MDSVAGPVTDQDDVRWEFTISLQVSNITDFNPSTPLPESDSPSPARSMHLLALVVDGSKFASYPQELITKMKSAIDCAKHPTRRIPRVVLVTHVDKVILCNVKIQIYKDVWMLLRCERYYCPHDNVSLLFLVKVRLRTEVQRTSSSTQPWFELMKSRS